MLLQFEKGDVILAFADDDEEKVRHVFESETYSRCCSLMCQCIINYLFLNYVINCSSCL